MKIKRIKGVWTKYVFYGTILILLHNLFIKYNFYSQATPKIEDFKQLIVPILNTMTFNCGELFSGALWFVPTILLAIGLFGGIIYIARKCERCITTRLKMQNENVQKYIKYIIILALTVLYAMLGTYLNINKLFLAYHTHTAFLVVPICTMGYFCREYIYKIKKLNKWYIMITMVIVTAIFLLYIIMEKGMQIELSQEKIINSYMFYIVSAIGISFCLSLASIIVRIPLLNKVIELCGKHSFSIMALHFACIKVVDVIYSRIINETNPDIISKWVTSYPEKLWIIYVIVGCIIPLIFSIIIEQIKEITGKIVSN